MNIRVCDRRRVAYSAKMARLVISSGEVAFERQNLRVTPL